MNRESPHNDRSAAAHPLATLLGVIAVGVLMASAAGCEQGLGGGAYAPPHTVVKVEAGAYADGAAEEATVADDYVPAGYGTFTGRVVLQGTPPDLPPTVTASVIKPDQAAVCVFENIPNERLMVGPNNGVANVFIYLAKRPRGAKMPESLPEEVIFDQKFCTFRPHALTLMTGQELRVLNDDAAPHNVNISAARNSLPNATIGANNREGIVLTYTRPEKEPVRVRCDIHAWMEAWQLPLDHPYSAVTAEDGSFTIPNLPADTHEFIVWHERAGEITDALQVTIEPDGTTTQEIPLDAAALAEFRGPQPRTVVLSALP